MNCYFRTGSTSGTNKGAQHFFVTLFLFACLKTVSASAVISLNTTGQPPLSTNNQSGFMDEVAEEAFRRIGVELQIVHLPAERGLKNANRGKIDGELARVEGIDKKYKNLIRVPEKIMDWEFVAFSYSHVSLKNGWKNLSGKSVSHINGWKILEKNIPNDSEVIKVSRASNLFNLLLKKRTDFAIYERWSGQYLLTEMSMKDVVLINPPLAKKEMFIYLHKKHKSIVPILAAALRKMKKDGTYKNIYKRKLSTFE